MNGERQDPLQGTINGRRNQLAPYTDLTIMRGASCELDAEGHCVTCSDEASEASVLRVDQESGLALVSVNDATEEIDITLVEDVGIGDLVLVHGGVAIARL